MPGSATKLETHVGSVRFANPVLAASGCFGTGAEKLGTVDATRLGAVVTKSMSAEPWPGNPPPRLVPVAGGGMLNAVGLQNPGVNAWREQALPQLESAGVKLVASIWGRSAGEFCAAAQGVAREAERIEAVEVNLSCPNLEGSGELIAHDAQRSAEIVSSVCEIVAPLPVWAKLSPNVASPVPVAAAVLDAGASALVLVNTLIGMHIDVGRRAPHLANVTGGLSGPPLRPVAIRMVYECREAFPEAAIVGVGGIVAAGHVVEFLVAGADAVEVGAAHFADPAAGVKIVRKLPRALRVAGFGSVAEAVSAAHTKASEGLPE